MVEYGKGQDSAGHHDNPVWSIASLNWVGSAVLLGLVIGRVGGSSDWKDGPHVDGPHWPATGPRGVILVGLGWEDVIARRARSR